MASQTIKIGNIEVKKIHLGNTEVTKVYSGSTLIWTSETPVLTFKRSSTGTKRSPDYAGGRTCFDSVISSLLYTSSVSVGEILYIDSGKTTIFNGNSLHWLLEGAPNGERYVLNISSLGVIQVIYPCSFVGGLGEEDGGSEGSIGTKSK